ncbi:uncharacterized protein A1O5_10322 [Cladophialophora psammophila CBS 110553]|uniref:Uncharacterized protein n=1 Tax=Cladophialophora psammophila CBS 110553 TaxID=1182543 RepID=W9WPP4_9EURO|nr:uncharacterized protein A1O5_10322 [Cladophialophora psammophila CBS 110553]EXJ66651.1 hypothetical protein A1O5_10322 [Cladophialophora psammophila CBS 110553]
MSSGSPSEGAGSKSPLELAPASEAENTKVRPPNGEMSTKIKETLFAEPFVTLPLQKSPTIPTAATGIKEAVHPEDLLAEDRNHEITCGSLERERERENTVWVVTKRRGKLGDIASPSSPPTVSHLAKQERIARQRKEMSDKVAPEGHHVQDKYESKFFKSAETGITHGCLFHPDREFIHAIRKVASGATVQSVIEQRNLDVTESDLVKYMAIFCSRAITAASGQCGDETDNATDDGKDKDVNGQNMEVGDSVEKYPGFDEIAGELQCKAGLIQLEAKEAEKSHRRLVWLYLILFFVTTPHLGWSVKIMIRVAAKFMF